MSFFDISNGGEGLKAIGLRHLRAGTYRFCPVRRIQTAEGAVDVWAALDALVLKALAIVLTRRLASHLSPRCTHLAGHGGSKAAVRAVARNLAANTFVLRTDVKSYYASIDHDILLDQLRPLIPDGRVLALIGQYLRHVIYDEGLYRDVRRGLARGCSLSPLLGGLYLHALDERLERLGLFYIRFMDDWIALLGRAAPGVLRVGIAIKKAECAQRTHPALGWIFSCK